MKLLLHEYGCHPNREYSFSAGIYRPVTRGPVTFGVILRTDAMSNVIIALAVTLDELLVTAWLPGPCERALFLADGDTGLLHRGRTVSKCISEELYEN